jgi:acetylserotonin N-methyltransferase
VIVAKENSNADPAVVLDLLESFRRSKTMFAAVSLGIFDALETGPKSLSALAIELKLNPDALERLLDACVGLQLLERANWVGPGLSLQAEPISLDRIHQLLKRDPLENVGQP